MLRLLVLLSVVVLLLTQPLDPGLSIGRSTAHAQPPADSRKVAALPGETDEEPRTLRRIVRDARRFVQAKRWLDAIEEYQRILDEAGDELVPVSDDRRHWQPARWLVHADLAKLPPEGLALYRQRVDGPAQKRLEQARAARDSGQLERLIADSFAARPSEQAMLLLADLASERGDFDRAESLLNLLTPGDGTSFRYPDPQTDPAQVQARLVLLAAQRGDTATAQARLTAFAQRHPDTIGTLAGKRGKLAQLLREQLDPADRLVVPPVSAAGWTTFAGTATRNMVVTRGLPVYWPIRPEWSAMLDPDGDMRTGVSLGQVFHPIIHGQKVLLADAARVWAFDLSTGKGGVIFDLRKDAAINPPAMALNIPVTRDLRYTLTASGTRVYARMGAQELRPAPPRPVAAMLKDWDSYIVCLGLGEPAAGKPSRGLALRWLLRAAQVDTETAFFEGAPVVVGTQLYTAVTRFEGNRAITSIDRYDGADGDDAPFRRWRVDVAEVSVLGATVGRNRHELLTLADSQLIYCTHTGLIVAVDAQTGKRTWAYRYPTRPDRPAVAGIPVPAPRAFRDLGPVVAAQGYVYAAPADAERIICLDAATGALVWQSEAVEVTQLLGVVEGRLICTTGSALRGIRAFDTRTGRDAWIKHVDGGLTTLGRGFLTDKFVFWPTVKGLRVLDHRNGEVVYATPADTLTPDAPLPLVGNLITAEGCLVAVTATQVHCYVSEGAKLDQRRRDALANPADAEVQYRYGLALADRGEAPAAQAALKTAQALGSRAAARARYELLAQTTPAMELLEQLDRFPASWQAATLARAADATATREPGQAMRLWQRILDTPALRQAWMIEPSGAIAQAGTLARAGQQALIDRAGPAVYAELAQAAAASGLTADELAQRYPHAPVTLARVRAQVQAAGGGGNGDGDAQQLSVAEARRLVLLTETVLTPAERAKAWADLARAQTKAGDLAAARLTWQRLVREWAAFAPAEARAALAQPPPRPPAQTLDLGPWLVRGGSLAIPTGERFVPSGQSPWQQSTNNTPTLGLWQSPDGRCVLRSLATGAAKPADSLPFAAQQTLIHADLRLALAPDGVAAFASVGGPPLWVYQPPAPGSPADSRTTPQFLTLDNPINTARLTGFRLAGSTLLFLQGRDCLCALDVDTGRLRWLRRASELSNAQTFTPYFFASTESVLVQTSAQRQAILDTHTGRVQAELAAGVLPWESEPQAIDAAQTLVALGQTDLEGPSVAVLDLVRGQLRWSRRIERDASLTGRPPRVAVVGGELFAIVERNFALELERCDMQTGRALWDEGFVFGLTTELRPELFAVDRHCVYIPHDQTLTAIDLTTGKRRYRVALPGTTAAAAALGELGGHSRPVARQAVRLKSALLVYPLAAEALATMPLADTPPRWPLDWRVARVHPLVGLLAPRADQLAALLRHRFDIALFQPDNGQPLAEVSLPSLGPNAQLVCGPDQLYAITPGQIVTLRTPPAN